MDYKKHEYVKRGDGWEITESLIVNDQSPIAQAVEKKAEENPGQVILGIVLDDEIKHVDVLEIKS